MNEALSKNNIRYNMSLHTLSTIYKNFLSKYIHQWICPKNIRLMLVC